ncbi:glucan biosynthesis protein [Aureimonas populi]|uniref:Glucan biosynthesis protein n=1 Tax=Aureimonas populi TaxID=1701758 RepID=A0ABW5CTM8_9HYPH|nr:glucan biosynthesis protein D [Aureimonas populi]
MTDLNRRQVLASLAALGLLPSTGAAFAQQDGVTLGDARPFSFEALVEDARRRATLAYTPAPPRASETLTAIDYDNHWRIEYRRENTLDLPGGEAPIRFFHLGRYFQDPVGVHVVENGEARPVLYDPALFRMPADSPARALPEDIGFAGFRVLEPGRDTDWLSFLGASYFRTSGEEGQFGMSARALAIDVALQTPEEFPRFTDFYLSPSPTGGRILVHASLESARITGALRMDMAKDGPVVMDIETRFFAREDIERVGIAPLVSMFWYSETDRRRREDWRPEVHDSDGLAMWTGTGERIWRPLNNPDAVMTSTFADESPKGFGLLQRDRDFDNYQDDGVFYEKRAGVWVEPKGDWGPGAVQLVEIPTDDEIHDNIAAYWLSDRPVRRGDEIALDYRLTWSSLEPYPAEVGHVVATRLGRGGVTGQTRPEGVTKIVVDFDGGLVAALAREVDDVETMVEVSSGETSLVDNYSVKVGTAWRASFDFRPENDGPVDMRLYLRRGDTILTETWLYQFHPTREDQAS